MSYVILMILLFGSFKFIYLELNNVNNEVSENGPYSNTSRQMFDFVKLSTNKIDRFVFDKPRAFLLYTSRDCMYSNNIYECVNKKVDYIVFNKLNYNFNNTDSILKYNSIMKLVYNNSYYLIYKMQISSNQ